MLGELVGGSGYLIEGKQAVAKRHAADASVVDAVIDVERHAFCVAERGQGGTFRGILAPARRIRRSAKGGFDVFGILIGNTIFDVFRVPGGDIGDGHPGRDARPNFWVACRHEEGHVTTPTGTDKVYAGRVNLGGFFHVLHRIDNVLHGEVRAEGVGSEIRAAEVRVNEVPALTDSPFGVNGTVGRLVVTRAPGMQTD